jgi:hypothetical protein
VSWPNARHDQVSGVRRDQVVASPAEHYPCTRRLAVAAPGRGARSPSYSPNPYRPSSNSANNSESEPANRTYIRPVLAIAMPVTTTLAAKTLMANHGNRRLRRAAHDMSLAIR